MSSFHDVPMKAPPAALSMLKDIDQWNFDIYDLNEKSEGNSLRCIGHQLLRSQGLIAKFRVRLLLLPCCQGHSTALRISVCL